MVSLPPRKASCVTSARFTIVVVSARDIAIRAGCATIIGVCGLGSMARQGMVVSAAAAKDEAGLGALDRLLAATAAEMQKVNALILTRADSHVEMVPELARYLIEAGGKRLRPMLTEAAAVLCGKPDGAQTNYAAAVEFM